MAAEWRPMLGKSLVCAAGPSEAQLESSSSRARPDADLDAAADRSTTAAAEDNGPDPGAGRACQWHRRSKPCRPDSESEHRDRTRTLLRSWLKEAEPRPAPNRRRPVNCVQSPSQVAVAGTAGGPRCSGKGGGGAKLS